MKMRKRGMMPKGFKAGFGSEKVLRCSVIQAMVVFLFLSSAAAFEVVVPMERDSNVLYRMSDHLSEAEAAILGGRGAKRAGEWDGSEIVFKNISKAFAVKKETMNFDNQPHEGIIMFPFQGTVRRIRFNGVPPGSVLSVHYGIEDASLLGEELSTIYMTVWAGRHKLTRIAIPVEKGWKTTELDLGVASFLLTNMIVTFDVTVDDEARRKFVFDAEILR